MIGLIAMAAGSIAPPSAVPDDLTLFRQVVAARFHASDGYRCEGMAPISARAAADQALGRGFDGRLARAAALLRQRHEPALVNEAGEIVAIGYKITPARCRLARSIVDDALAGMRDLEVRLGVY